MAYVITGNFWKNSDKKETVARTWESVERWLKENYDASFSEVSMNTRGVLHSIREYGGLEVTPKNEELALEEITRDITSSRANFLRKIERVGYSVVNEDFNMGGVPLARSIFIEPLVLYYGPEKDYYRYSFSIQPKNSFFIRPATFYQGNDLEYSKREDKREERFLAKAIDASSLIVSVRGFGPVGLKSLGQFYRQNRK